MNLDGLISVSGKQGLFKIIKQTKNGFIVQSLLDNKNMVISSTSKMSALQDIAIYTYDGEVSLEDVFDKIRKKEKGEISISHKSSSDELLQYFKEVLESFDEDRVYVSNIKKVIYWYNLLQKHGMTIIDKEEIKNETNKQIKKE